MADRKISDLTALTAPASGDYLPIVDISEAAAANKNKRITIEELFRGVPLGTAAAPSIAIEGDENTGIYSPGADQLAISTGGTGRLFVDASGRVSIGSSNPGGQPLAVSGGAILVRNDTDLVRFNDAADSTYWFRISRNSSNIELSNRQAGALAFLTSDVERLRITSTGTVNIVGAGTAGSTQAVSFNGSAPVNSLVVDSSGRCGVGTSSPSVKLEVSGSTSSNPEIRVVDGTVNSQWYVSNTGELIFGTFSNHPVTFRSNGSPRLSISSAGNVGIGTTTSPSAKLHVFGTGSSSNTLPANASAVFETDGNAVLAVSVPSASAGGVVFPRGTDAYYAGIERAGTDLNLRNNGSTCATIDSSGRLLVGTSTSRSIGDDGQSPLQISGTGYGGLSIINNRNDLSGAAISLAKNRSGSVGGSTIVQSGDLLGSINFAGADGTDVDTNGATIQCFVDGTPGSNDMPGRLVFSTTADGASSPTERMRITNDGQTYFGITGNTGLGTTNRGFLIRNEIAGKTYVQLASTGTTTDTVFYFYNGNGLVGSISMNGSATAYNTSSDYRLKENVAPVPDGIARLQQLKPSRFNFIADPATTVDGFIAHEVQAVVPEAITGEKDAVDDDGNPIYQGIDQSKLVPLLTAALQEAVAKIESLEARLTAAGI